MRHIVLITTGGTIEKTYDERTGSLENRQSVVRQMLGQLRLEDSTLACVELLSKDSLLMTDADRDRIAGAVKDACDGSPAPTGIVILHGTDTLAQTGERLVRERPPVPVVLTGAMRPFEMVRSDALQNLTEALFAASVLAPGVYFAGHGRALAFPGVVKDREHGTFIREST